MVDINKGEFIQNEIKKKKLKIFEGEKEIPISDFREQIGDILDEYKFEEFEELDRTVLALGKCLVGSLEELHGFMLGFFAGTEFERRTLKIKIEDTKFTREEMRELSKLQIGPDGDII